MGCHCSNLQVAHIDTNRPVDEIYKVTLGPCAGHHMCQFALQ